MEKDISIIIVAYKAREELFACLNSVKSQKTNHSYEVIVVDNNEESGLKRDLQRKLPGVQCVRPSKNLGYGGGNNFGVKHSIGKYIFILNPDTFLLPDALENLVNQFRSEDKAGVVAPLLLDSKKHPYPLQGTKRLTPAAALFSLSFINTLFPNNPISHRYWMRGWDKSKKKEVSVVPGTAFMISRELFLKVGGFDENFFLYFEEMDLCKRVEESGYKLYITPRSQIIHHWGKSTSQSKQNIKQIFLNSRYYYFKKNYGVLWACIVEAVLRFNKFSASLVGILIWSAFLRFYNIHMYIPFIGDQGWFYLSARDLVYGQSFPLIGITASHTWLHQGPLWTYVLAIILSVTHFSPWAASYVTAFFGVLTVFLIYFLGTRLFSQLAGILASFLYATSPLVINHSRFSYHTSLIPFVVTIFLLSLYKLFTRRPAYLPISIALLAILYNLELVTIVWYAVLFCAVLFLFFSDKKYFYKVVSIKNIMLSIGVWSILMLPILIYDVHHNFVQTAGLVLWTFYQAVKPILHHSGGSPFPLNTVYSYSQNFIFLPQAIVGLLIILLALCVTLFVFLKQLSARYLPYNIFLLSISVFIPVVGFLGAGMSEAYVPMLFPPLILAIAYSIYRLLERYLFVAILLVIMMSCINSYLLLINNYYLDGKSGHGLSIDDRITAAREIIKLAGNKPYTLVGRGENSNFESFSANYQYLTWWLGHPPSHTSQQNTIYISELNNHIQVYK